MVRGVGGFVPRKMKKNGKKIRFLKPGPAGREEKTDGFSRKKKKKLEPGVVKR